MGINPELLKQARSYVGHQKVAFVPTGDPAMGGDPAAGGGAPPMDPAMGGGAPPMGGGAPPMDPAAGGGAPPEDPMAAIMPMIQQAVQQAMATQGGGAGGAPGEAAIKPKIDINVEVMQMKKLLAKLCDAMGVQVPAAEMVATPDDLSQMAEGGPGAAAMTPDGGGMGGAPGGGAMGGAIPPIDPMKAASEEWETGVSFAPPASYDFQNAHSTTKNTANLAAAMLLRSRSRAS